MEDNTTSNVETTDSWQWGKIIKHVILPKPKDAPKAGKKELGARIGIGAVFGLIALSIFSNDGVPTYSDSDTTFTVPEIAQITTEQSIELANYVNSKVDQSTIKKVQKMSQCSAIAKFFDDKLSDDLFEQSLGKLLINSDIDKKIAENYMVVGVLGFTRMLVEKQYIDQDNPEGSKTINATKGLYSKMCSGL